MTGLDVLYAEAKSALLTLVGSPDSSSWAVRVPATPDWTVRDVVAHVTGNAVDGAQGTVPADLNLLEQFRDAEVVKARDEFADGQVHRREGRTPAELIGEWDEAEPELLRRFRLDQGAEGALPFGFDVVLLTDLCVHSDDVANALDRPPNRDSGAARVAFSGYCFGVDYRIRALGLPALRVRYGAKEKTLGEGRPEATVSADAWELLRAFAGRRSRKQIAALDWDGDPEPYLALIPAYGERADALVEG
jgi:uncharacterized protein (TIGR03083 family)